MYMKGRMKIMNDTVMLKEIHETLERIPECSKYNEENLKEITEAIKNFKPDNIVIVARGTSLHSAMYAKYLLEIYYKIPVSLAAKSVFTVYDTDMNLSKSLVIAISQSGKGKDITKAIEKAYKSGALTIGITNELESIIKSSHDQKDSLIEKSATKLKETALKKTKEIVEKLESNSKI